MNTILHFDPIIEDEVASFETIQRQNNFWSRWWAFVFHQGFLQNHWLIYSTFLWVPRNVLLNGKKLEFVPSSIATDLTIVITDLLLYYVFFLKRLKPSCITAFILLWRTRSCITSVYQEKINCRQLTSYYLINFWNSRWHGSSWCNLYRLCNDLWPIGFYIVHSLTYLIEYVVYNAHR